MPRGDGTGPNGLGTMTGRGAGYCTGNDVAGYETAGYAAFGCGRGRGFRRQTFGGYQYAPRTAEKATDEKTVLNNQAEVLRKRLVILEQRLAALDGEE